MAKALRYGPALVNADAPRQSSSQQLMSAQQQRRPAQLTLQQSRARIRPLEGRASRSRSADRPTRRSVSSGDRSGSRVKLRPGRLCLSDGGTCPVRQPVLDASTPTPHESSRYAEDPNSPAAQPWEHGHPETAVAANAESSTANASGRAATLAKPRLGPSGWAPIAHRIGARAGHIAAGPLRAPDEGERANPRAVLRCPVRRMRPDPRSARAGGAATGRTTPLCFT